MFDKRQKIVAIPITNPKIGLKRPLGNDRFASAVAQVRRLLDDDDYTINSRLPPERELAFTLQISRGCLRTALAKLEAEGRIWRHVGQGTFVGGRAPQSKDDAALISNRTSPSEVFEARLAIEPQCAAYAALRATREDLDRLQHCFQKMARAPNSSNFFRWDSTLHRVIAEAAHSSLLLHLFDAVNATREQIVWSDLFRTAMHREGRDATHRQHEGIVEAITKRNSSTAARLTREHIEEVRKYLLNS